MSAPHIILGYLLSVCQKNCQILWKFDVVITKIILLVFFPRHGVVFDCVHIGVGGRR